MRRDQPIDGPYTVRPVLRISRCVGFGKIRYMNEKGLRRKFAIDEYVRRIEKTGEK